MEGLFLFCGEALFKNDPFFIVSNIKYTFYSFDADWKTRKDGINPLFACLYASSLPIRMEIRTEVLILKIAYTASLNIKYAHCMSMMDGETPPLRVWHHHLLKKIGKLLFNIATDWLSYIHIKLSGLTQVTMNCETTNRKTFEKRTYFQGVSVSSPVIYCLFA